MRKEDTGKTTWETLERDYKQAMQLSCRPDSSFPYPKEGSVLDEEKSVRWNREEVNRLRTAYTEEVKRLNREKNATVNQVTKRIVKLLASELQVSEEKAKILWDFLYEKYHAFGDMFAHVDEYVELVNTLK